MTRVGDALTMLTLPFAAARRMLAGMVIWGERLVFELRAAKPAMAKLQHL